MYTIDMGNNSKFGRAVQTSVKAFKNMFPVLLGTILLVSLVIALVPMSWYASLFRWNEYVNSVIGSLLGSVSAGNPIVSYIIGGELLDQGVSITAVTAFLVAWVTVGLVQLPAEMALLGKRFALYRNGFAFISSMVVAIVVTTLMRML
jgi:uncharacterized membrane protein YraQ (UPF0718 family)